jgi:hypothetical protein
MSMQLNFEPHSWYMGFAIGRYAPHLKASKLDIPYFAVTDNGMTYQVDTIEAKTLRELKKLIKEYRSK